MVALHATREGRRTILRKRMERISLHLYLNLHPAREAEALETFDGLERRFGEVYEAAVDAHFVLVARVLVDERRLIDREFADAGRKRKGAVDHGAGTFRSIEDLGGRLIENMMIEGGEADAKARRRGGEGLLCLLLRSPLRSLSPFWSDVLLAQRRLL